MYLKNIFVIFIFQCVISQASPLVLDSLPSHGDKLYQKTDQNPYLEIENYLDVNYAYDFNKPYNQVSLYSSNPLNVNQLSLSYAYSQIKYESHKIRFVTAIATGGITKLMYLAEPSELKWIRELSLLYKFKKEGWGIEAGILPSVYGIETFINRDNQHASRAIMTDFAPDFEQGVRFHYRVNRFWSGKFQITNGWQVLKDNNNAPAFGWINIFGNEKKSFFNIGLFAGEEPYQNRNNKLKVYVNSFAKLNIAKFSIWPMVDIGAQKDSLNQFRYWYSMGASVKYAINEKLAFALRAERINDRDAIITELINPTNQWIHNGYTATLQFIPTENLILRLEVNLTKTKTKVFTTSDISKLEDYKNILMLAAHYTLPNIRFHFDDV